MIRFLKLFAVLSSVACLCGAHHVHASTFLLIQEAGVYTVQAMAPQNADTAYVSIEDFNTGEELAKKPAIPLQLVTFTITVPVTPGADRRLVGYAFDTSGNKSAPSDETAIIDFTPPDKVVLSPTTTP